MKGQVGRVHPDLVGKNFDRLKVIKFNGTNRNGRATWLCKCSCGNMVVTTTNKLLSGRKRSCGCLIREVNSKRMSVHGFTSSYSTADMQRLFQIYRKMIDRCYKCNDPSYANYGGRGIYICDDWINSDPFITNKIKFMNFYNWSINNGYSNKLTIDRIDNDGPYAPWNCRWVTLKVQANNRRSNHHINDDGIIYTFTEFERKYNLYEKYVTRHIHRGYTKDEVIFLVHNPNLKMHKTSTGNFIDKDGFYHLIPKHDQPED